MPKRGPGGRDGVERLDLGGTALDERDAEVARVVADAAGTGCRRRSGSSRPRVAPLRNGLTRIRWDPTHRSTALVGRTASCGPAGTAAAEAARTADAAAAASEAAGTAATGTTDARASGTAAATGKATGTTGTAADPASGRAADPASAAHAAAGRAASSHAAAGHAAAGNTARSPASDSAEQAARGARRRERADGRGGVGLRRTRCSDRPCSRGC